MEFVHFFYFYEIFSFYKVYKDLQSNTPLDIMANCFHIFLYCGMKVSNMVVLDLL